MHLGCRGGFYDGGARREGREGRAGRGVSLPLLSGDQCSASELGWLLGIPQWDYSGQENMESQRKRHSYKAVHLDASVCGFKCVCVCVCVWLSTSVPIPLRVNHCACVCMCFWRLLMSERCIMHDKKTICKAALALI